MVTILALQPREQIMTSAPHALEIDLYRTGPPSAGRWPKRNVMDLARRRAAPFARPLAPAAPAPISNGIDKSQLTIAEPKRHRDKAHLKFVASQPCLICGRQPSDPHHLRFAQPRALGLKVSDEFTVPLCRGHHRQLHQAGDEYTWWNNLEINALEIAKGPWEESRTKTVRTTAKQQQAQTDPRSGS